MNLGQFGDLAGGIGLFLLGMHLMTNGMKQAAGQGLKRTLQTATSSPLKGLLAGILITALVQSSSAVTVATIGFVNAGLLRLRQSITVIYGCNIGTTMTGWLVALIGFKLKISAFALPLVGLGMLINLSAGENRRGHFGMALAGFGLFFIGLDFLKGAFDGLEQQLPLEQISHAPAGLILFVVAGFILTFLMQSSSAAMAITLSLTAAGAIPLPSAGALVIGANLGTTSTAMLSVIGATSNAKRIAAAHVLFNLLTGIVGLLILFLLAGFAPSQNESANLVVLLAAFHTLFNLMGVVLMWPLTDRLEQFLQRRFRSQEEQLSQPRYLDDTVLASPALAIEAMSRELSRVSEMTSAMARAAISAEPSEVAKLKAWTTSLQGLNDQIGRYNQKIALANLTEEISAALPVAMRISRYYSEIARLSALMPKYYPIFEQITDHSLQKLLYEYQHATIELIDSCEIHPQVDSSGLDSRRLIQQMEKQYQILKSHVMESSIAGRINPQEGIELLEGLSHIHRLSGQVEKASRYWSSLTPIQPREPIAEAG
ncbi:Na/Pi cotransporter family protein [Neptuniibacter halophilus]|uniref:Na/Pi cotransporter family protein n=1 Tax=Neptuniibacter halophilus TaxID=651666 RepID=UPI0025745FAC|nr:Na/Pi cotransporter family protein [Neptuniibacter halophilus]